MAWTTLLQNEKPVYSSHPYVYRVQLSCYPTACYVKSLPCGGDSDVDESAIRELAIVIAIKHRFICPVLAIAKETVFELRANQDITRIFIVTPEMPNNLQLAIDKRSHDRENPNNYYSESELWGYFENLLEVFVYLQEKDIAHRDIKPSNILLTADNTVQLIDFDFAKKRDSSGRMHTILGTGLYLSPILRRHNLMGPGRGAGVASHDLFKSDVYSLGLVLLYMTTLELKSVLTELTNLQANLSRCIDQVRPEYSMKWVALLRKMLQVDEKFRPNFLTLRTQLDAREDNIPRLPPAMPASSVAPAVRCGRDTLGFTDIVPCVIELHAPALPHPRGVDIVILLDLTANLSRDWTHCMQGAVLTFISHLGESDRVAIVTSVTQLSRLIACSDKGKKELTSLLSTLETDQLDSNFDISTAFQTAVNVFRTRLITNSLSHLAIFTSGNSFLPSTDIPKTCQTTLTSSLRETGHLVITYWAVGPAVNLSVLKPLVECTGGVLTPVSELDSASEVIVQKLLSLRRVAVEKVKVEVEIADNFEKVVIYSQSGEGQFYVPYILSEEKVEFVLRIKPKNSVLSEVTNCALRVKWSLIDHMRKTNSQERELQLRVLPCARVSAAVSVDAFMKWSKAKAIACLKNLEAQSAETVLARLESAKREIQGTGLADRLGKDLERMKGLVGAAPHWRLVLAATAYPWQAQMGCFNPFPSSA